MTKQRFLEIILVLFFGFSLISCSNHENITSNSQDIPDELLKKAETTSEISSHNDTIVEADPLDKAITTAIIEQNRGKYLQGECYGVGYKIIEKFEEDPILSVYALTEYVEYRFEDDVFVNISGSNPNVLMRFQRTENEGYELVFYTRLDVLSGLSEKELEELIQPLTETGKDYIYTDEDLQEVRKQADKCAFDYLKSIDRTAEIGMRQNHAGLLLEDIVPNEELLDVLFKDEEICLYPNWTGTTERIEKGERYIYQTLVDEEAQKIIYRKMKYSTKDVIKEILVEIQSGTIIGRK